MKFNTIECSQLPKGPVQSSEADRTTASDVITWGVNHLHNIGYSAFVVMRSSVSFKPWMLKSAQAILGIFIMKAFS